MGFDLRRCAEAAVQAALAEAFKRPDPKRARRGRTRRLRPLRAMLRLVRVCLMAVGLVTTVRLTLDAELRRQALGALAERIPIDDLLGEIAVEVDAARAAFADATAAENTRASGPENDEAAGDRAGKERRRRPVARTRGDRNGQRGRKPPDRGTRAA